MIFTSDFTHGKGLWKFNNSLLIDATFLDLIHKEINSIKSQYAIYVYNHENLSNIPNSEIQFIINDQLFLETLLLASRGKTISYSSYIKKKNTQIEKQLEKEILELERNFQLNSTTVNGKKQNLKNAKRKAKRSYDSI